LSNVCKRVPVFVSPLKRVESSTVVIDIPVRKATALAIDDNGRRLAVTGDNFIGVCELPSGKQKWGKSTQESDQAVVVYFSNLPGPSPSPASRD